MNPYNDPHVQTRPDVDRIIELYERGRDATAAFEIARSCRSVPA